MKNRVLLLSTIHPATDPRIVLKIAPSLAEHYQVYCCLPNTTKNNKAENITTKGLPYFKNLALRILICHPLALLKSVLIRPKIVHIFVPELIPVALILQWFGATIIYEVQENLLKKFEIKTYNNSFLFRNFWKLFDKIARKKFNFVFTEHSYPTYYTDLRHDYEIIHNYASIDLINQHYKPRFRRTPPEFFYCGIISKERSFDIMLKAFSILNLIIPDFKVNLFGPVRISKLELMRIEGFEKLKHRLNFYGYTDFRVAIKKAEGATAGIALLKPVADYPESYTTKLFEYMAMELPVITSNFALYSDVIEDANCGFCIDPNSPEILAEKLLWLINNPNEAKNMGENGKKSAVLNYNWTKEMTKLLMFYKKLENDN